MVEAVGAKGFSDFLALEVDLTDDKSVEQSLAEANEQLGKLGVIVNNAGYGISGSIEELSMKEISKYPVPNFLL